MQLLVLKLKKKFDPENMKKPPSKVANNRPPTFFMYWPSCPNSPETEILYYQRLLNSGLGIYTGLNTENLSGILLNRHFFQ